jgi:hypothetical protein
MQRGPVHICRPKQEGAARHTQVNVLPPYHPNDQEQREPKLYAANVRRAVACSLGINPDLCVFSADDAKAFYSTVSAQFK